MDRKPFIVLEGADGSGKTTLALKLAHELRGIYTREPSDKSINTLQGFLDDRHKHDVKIMKWLNDDNAVVCDRYKLSTVVYQHIEGYNLQYLTEICCYNLVPDLTIVLDLPVDQLMRNIKRRGGQRSKYENEETLTQVSKLYRLLPRFFPNDRFYFIRSMDDYDIKNILELLK